MKSGIAIVVPPPQSAARFTARLIISIAIATTAFLMVNYCANLLISLFGRDAVKEHVAAAFTNGDLDLPESRPLDSGMGVHQTNDCLIFDMASRPATQMPLYLFAASATAQYNVTSAERCEYFRNWVLEDPTTPSGEGIYYRYIHGYRLVAVVLLSLFSVVDARLIMKVSSYGVFIALCLFNAWALYRRVKASDRRQQSLGNVIAASNELAYVGIGLSALLFFGLPYFGQSISHAPALVTLGVFLILWSRRDLRGELNLQRMTRMVIVFSLFTAYFEFLTGYVPVACVVLCLLAGISDRKTRFVEPLTIFGRLVAIEFAFMATLLAAFMLHLVFTAVFTSDPEVLSGFFAQLAFRMSTQVSKTSAAGDGTGVPGLTLGDVIDRLLGQIPHIGVPDQFTGLTTLLIAFGLVLFGLGEVWFSNSDRDSKWRALVIASALVPLALWVIAFKNHTFVHARFMVRILVSVYMTAAVMGFWLFAVKQANAKQARHGLAIDPALTS